MNKELIFDCRSILNQPIYQSAAILLVSAVHIFCYSHSVLIIRCFCFSWVHNVAQVVEQEEPLTKKLDKQSQERSPRRPYPPLNCPTVRRHLNLWGIKAGENISGWLEGFHCFHGRLGHLLTNRISTLPGYGRALDRCVRCQLTPVNIRKLSQYWTVGILEQRLFIGDQMWRNGSNSVDVAWWFQQCRT
jgi:hypothetical protein